MDRTILGLVDSVVNTVKSSIFGFGAVSRVKIPEMLEGSHSHDEPKKTVADMAYSQFL